jgi:hypothetical protein
MGTQIRGSYFDLRWKAAAKNNLLAGTLAWMECCEADGFEVAVWSEGSAILAMRILHRRAVAEIARQLTDDGPESVSRRESADDSRSRSSARLIVIVCRCTRTLRLWIERLKIFAC